MTRRVATAGFLLCALAAQALAGPAAAPSVDSAALSKDVRAEFLYAWQAYKRHAWGHDELAPLSRAPKDWYGASLWMTPVDALDTMLLMGLTEEAEKTKTAILENLSFDKDANVQTFEITIRILGGLLSSYQLTQDRRLLALAEDLGTRLLPAFGSPTGMPYTHVNLKTGSVAGPRSNPAEIGTLILEFGTLARLTGKDVFFQKPKAALIALYDRRARTGLVGESINVETGQWLSPSSHLGGGIDSYYEYLVKCERLFGDRQCGDMARQSLTTINRRLADDGPNGLWYGQADMLKGQRTATTFGALAAFFPAVLALSGDIGQARRLQESVARMWALHGIEPETLDYASMRVIEPAYALRPEAIESTYYLYRLTRDPKYLAMGRGFFEDLRKYCRTENGYTILASVVSKEKGDSMPSYFLAETLKYLYLLFTPDALDFGKVVFNTEAHPLRKTW